jgi:hypothetical protein
MQRDIPIMSEDPLSKLQMKHALAIINDEPKKTLSTDEIIR